MSKRRVFTPELKVRVVLEMISGQKTLMEASRAYGIEDHTLSRWKTEFLERAPQLFGDSTQEEHSDKRRIAELERMVGRLTMELDMAKKVFGYSGSRLNGNEKL